MRFIRHSSAVRGPSDGVLDVGQALLSTALNLLDLALGFLVPVAGQLAEPFLDLTLGLVCGAFGAQVGQVDTPLAMPAHAVVNADGPSDPGLRRRQPRGSEHSPLVWARDGWSFIHSGSTVQQHGPPVGRNAR